MYFNSESWKEESPRRGRFFQNTSKNRDVPDLLWDCGRKLGRGPREHTSCLPVAPAPGSCPGAGYQPAPLRCRRPGTWPLLPLRKYFKSLAAPSPPLIDQERLWACDLCAQVCKTDTLRFHTCTQKLVGVLNLAFLFFSSTLFDCPR